MSIAAGEETVPALPSTLPPPARRPGGDQAWVWQVTGLCVVLGLMLALALRTTQTIRSRGLPMTPGGVSAAEISSWMEQNERLEREIDDLRGQVRDFEENRKSDSAAAGLLKEQIRLYRALTGFGSVRGPGLRITLRNSTVPRQPGTQPSDYWVTDDDVNGLVSELRAAGAEAVALDGRGARQPERFIVNTTVHGNGTAMTINGRTLASPLAILVIGNPKELRAAIEMPDGIIQNRALNVLQMIEIEESQNLVLPAYSGGGSAGAAPAADH